MRTTLIQNLSVAFLGLAATASARPSDRPADRDRPIQPERVGTPPAHTMRMDVQMRAGQDGRGDRDEARAEHRPIYTRPTGQTKDHGYKTDHMVLPIKNDIRNRVQIGDGGENARDLTANAQGRRESADAANRLGHRSQPTGQDKGYAPRSHAAPIAIKSDIALKIGAADGQETGAGATVAAKPDTLRGDKMRKDGQDKDKDKDAAAQVRNKNNVPMGDVRASFRGRMHGQGGSDDKDER